eukprot:jgi/Botrbrau1/9776/Bobra.85_1s0021.1
MLSTCGRRLTPFLCEQSRCFITASSQLAAAPAVVEAKAESEGFLSSIFGSSRTLVPMTEPFPGVAFPPAEAVDASRPPTEQTTLPNGITIASEATPGPTATVGIYVDSGSIYENPGQTGLSHLLEYMAFKSTLHRTHFRLVREVEAIGANVTASASREQMVYNIDCVKSLVPQALEIVCDAVLYPKFNPWEVEQQVNRLKEDVKVMKANNQTALLEGLHEVAFTGALAKPLLAPESVIPGFSAEALTAFVAENYTAPRIALAAAGVGHADLLSWAKPLVGGLPSAPKSPSPTSTYVGGDWRQYAASPVTHLLIAFNAAGGWRDVKTSVVLTVLQFLLGGGGSFSAGGPGKGMHSRLYARVLNQYAWAHSCTAFSSLYNDNGLFGILISPDSSKVAEAVAVACKELQAVASDVPVAELERAKNAAISSILMNLESRAVVAEDIGRQILTYGHRKSTAEFVDAMKGLTPKDVSSVVAAALKTPPSVAALGDISSVPRYDAIARRFT